jgi:hypothetical protein
MALTDAQDFDRVLLHNLLLMVRMVKEMDMGLGERALPYCKMTLGSLLYECSGAA